ncbi:MAG: acyl-CoA thioesterase [Candidatus Eremiobacteraeota bacterium]|nr:acyl-CoA thioesterase [Candidatus Eremiobacteraeota bacterium]MBV8223398.1 acyl-CoA thioesterase [Candidatus Eremiobacteraeota bacterium]MBV8280881.1 acyl-CoA thioesterase [Candidatus Eremiobacteraeota bacterium]
MGLADKSPSALAPKPVAASATTLATLMEPADANPMGNVHGGVIMKLVDQAAAAAAIRHSGRICVTVAVDRLDFFGPVHVGDMVTLKAAVNYTHRTSMEVGVEIHAETLREGRVRRAGTALLIFVALDDQCQPTVVPPILAETEEEQLRYRQAELRYRHRKELREKERALRNTRAH